MAGAGSGRYQQIQDEHEKWICELLARGTISPSSSIKDPPASLLGISMSITVEDLLQARSASVPDAPVLEPGQTLLDWSTCLLDRFTAEVLKHLILDTKTTQHLDYECDLNEDAHSQADSSPAFMLLGPSQNATEESLLFQSAVSVKTEEDQEEDFDSKQGILPDQDTRSDATNHSDALNNEDDGSLTDNSGIIISPPKQHKKRLSKNVPASFAYWFRGVRCPICFKGFRGQKCVIQVMQHLQTYHKDELSPRVLKYARENTRPEKVIGAGMIYCDCQSCFEAYRLEGYLRS